MVLYNEICEKLKTELDSERYEHTIGVMYTAGALAMAYGYDVNKAMLAGLLHDCAKCLTHEVRLELCEKHQVEVTESEFKNKSLSNKFIFSKILLLIHIFINLSIFFSLFTSFTFL